MRMPVAGFGILVPKTAARPAPAGAHRRGAFFVLASFLRWILGGMSEGFGPMTFLPAILLAGLFGGIRIGLAFAALCTLVAWVMFFPPYGTFTLDSAQRITMVIFVFTAALELYVIRTLNLAIHDAVGVPRTREHPVSGGCSTGLRTTSSSSRRSCG